MVRGPNNWGEVISGWWNQGSALVTKMEETKEHIDKVSPEAKALIYANIVDQVIPGFLPINTLRTVFLTYTKFESWLQTQNQEIGSAWRDADARVNQLRSQAFDRMWDSWKYRWYVTRQEFMAFWNSLMILVDTAKEPTKTIDMTKTQIAARTLKTMRNINQLIQATKRQERRHGRIARTAPTGSVWLTRKRRKVHGLWKKKSYKSYVAYPK
jgi:hypothetical protein